MKVYVLEIGCYSNSGVSGVFATPEAAMEAHSPPRPANSRHAYEWDSGGESGWGFDADWDDYATVSEYTLQGGDEQEPASPRDAGDTEKTPRIPGSVRHPANNPNVPLLDTDGSS